MSSSTQKVCLLAVCLGMLSFFIPSNCFALNTIKFDDDSSLTVHGFFRNNLGVFLDEQPYAISGNDLATARTWFRGYIDWEINDQFSLWSAIQCVYEPNYAVEDGATSSSEPAQRAGKTEGWREYSEYSNINDVLREFYIEWKPSRRHSLKIGRQIAIWGEALTDRIGDVVHANDSRFTLAFANLEDTRIPSWMIRGIHAVGDRSFFEWIYNPNVVQDYYTVNRLASNSALGAPGQRFGLNPETSFEPPYSVTNPFLGAPFTTPGVVVGHPFSRDWVKVAPGFWVPTALPYVEEEYPTGWWRDSRFGFRTNSFIGGYSFGCLYFHTQNYDPLVKRGNIIAPATREYTLVHPNIDIFGLYMNKDLTSVPGVFRTEAIYIPNKPYNTFDTSDADALDRTDYVKYLMAYDLSGYFYFQWKKDASFDVTLEHVAEWVPDNDDLQYITYNTNVRTYNPQFNLRVFTTWRYAEISTEIIASYFPWGNSGLIMPIVKYTSPWQNQRLSVELRYINVFGEDETKGLGILNTKDMLVLTTQVNW